MLDISSNFLDNSEGEDDDDYLCYNDNQFYIRISTAPARPLNEIEGFKRSKEFLILEQAVFMSSQLIHKNYQKYDLDSDEGQKICKKFLYLIEKLSNIYLAKQQNKDYRKEFSKAYQILYKDGASYLTEILDSAQEAFPYLWVNGEKYVFSVEVLEAGISLLNQFFKLQNNLRSIYQKIFQDMENNQLQRLKQEIINQLENFDLIWSNFENVKIYYQQKIINNKLYVTELMVIEKDARRLILKAITLEKELMSIEIREKLKGKLMLSNNLEYKKLRIKLCKTISHINSVANFEGKGREDLDYNILEKAEEIVRKISREQSKAVRCLADKIRNSFIKIRQLLQYYDQNIETVDPQLKNNTDLVDLLVQYENSWEMGKNYFINDNKLKNLIQFSQILENTSEKYLQFQEDLDCRDANVFIQIPALLILKNLNNEDKNIVTFFLPQLFEANHPLNNLYNQLKYKFVDWKNHNSQNEYTYFNLVEKCILNISQDFNDEYSNSQINSISHIIKQIAIELERNQPTEWNGFIEAALIQ